MAHDIPRVCVAAWILGCVQVVGSTGNGPQHFPHGHLAVNRLLVPGRISDRG